MASDYRDTPSKLIEQETIEQHRAIFNLNAFGIDNDGVVVDESKVPKKNSKALTQEVWARILHVLSTWKTEEEIAKLSSEEKDQYNSFKSTHKKEWLEDKKEFYRWKKTFEVEEGRLASGEPIKRLVRIDEDKSDSERRLVVPMLEVFDIIHQSHSITLGHMGEERTFADMSKKYYNPTQEMVAIFIKSCLHCNQKQPVIKALKGAKKPISSKEFRDRFQVDLIDMRKKRMRNIYGVMQRWIMTIKDHATGITYIKSLPKKKAKYVAHELDHIFGFIGYPTIFHTDNGKEFVANVIIQMLKENNPNILTVTGRPRTPRDQGSVESMNKLIKRVLSCIESEVKTSGKDSNWTNLLGRLMSVVNNQMGRGCYAETAYRAVFGQDYHQHFKCSMAELRECNTINERLEVMEDSRLENVARELCFLGNEEGDPKLESNDENGYWSEDSEPDKLSDVASDGDVGSTTHDDTEEKSICVGHGAVDDGNDDVDRMVSTLDNFHMETQNDSIGHYIGDHINLSPEKLVAAETLLQVCGCNGLDLNIEGNDDSLSKETVHCTPQKNIWSIKETESILMQIAGSTPFNENPAKMCKENENIVDVAKVNAVNTLTKKEFGSPAKQASVVSSYSRKLYDVQAAWTNRRTINIHRKYGGRNNTLTEYTFVYPTLLCETCCFFGSCLVPVGDERYLSDSEYTKRWWDTDFISAFAALVAHEAHTECHIRPIAETTQLIHCQNPRANPDESECNLLDPTPDRVVSVLHNVDHYSVLEADLKRRNVKIYDGLRRSLDNWKMHVVNIIKRCGQADRMAAFTFVYECNHELRQTLLLKVGEQIWTIENVMSVKQRDSHNCGPIACMKIMELYGCTEARIIDPKIITVEYYRGIVISKFRSLVMKFTNKLNVSFLWRSLIWFLLRRTGNTKRHPLKI